MELAIVEVVLFVGRFVLLAMLYLFIVFVLRAMLSELRRAGACLVVVQNGMASSLAVGAVFALSDETIIGREPPSTLLLHDRFVSSQHARIFRSPDGFVLEELGSTNGTRVNGKVITTPVLLRSGDEIEIGTVVLKFKSSNVFSHG